MTTTDLAPAPAAIVGVPMMDQTETAREALRSALWRYGAHLGGCALAHDGPCSCGLSAARREGP